MGAGVLNDSTGRISEEGDRTYAWDDFSALVAVTEAGNLREALQYDGLGRLVARWNATGLTEELAYDGAQMVTAFDSGEAVKWQADWAPGLDSLLSISDGTGEYLALEDGKANVVGYFRADDSQLAGTASYTTEGRVTWTDFRGTDCAEQGTTRCGPLLGFPFGFHGAYKSEGTGLVYFRNRWYSTEAGQWLSQDPLGYVDSFSLYAFNKFDPVNFVDPWGLMGDENIVPGKWGLDLCDGACQEAAEAQARTDAAQARTAETSQRRMEGLAAHEPKPEKENAGPVSPPNPPEAGSPAVHDGPRNPGLKPPGLGLLAGSRGVPLHLVLRAALRAVVGAAILAAAAILTVGGCNQIAECKKNLDGIIGDELDRQWERGHGPTALPPKAGPPPIPAPTPPTPAPATPEPAPEPEPQTAAGGAGALSGGGGSGKAIDPNKLNHIFGKAAHNLEGVVQAAGSQTAAFEAIQAATQAAVTQQGLTGVFNVTVKVGSTSVAVRGSVVDGVAKIGTAWVP